MVDSGAETTNDIATLGSHNLHEIRNTLLVSAHEEVQKSDFTASLTQIQSHLDAIPDEPLRPGALSSVTNEQEMEKAIVDMYSTLESADPYLSSWTTSYSRQFIAILLATLMTVGFTGVVLSAAVGSWLLHVGSIFSMFLGTSLVFAEFNGQLLNIRNKVIRRKAYKRELARMVGEAESARERYARLRGVRKAKIELARKALEPLSADFAIANPGKFLDIIGDEDEGRLSIEAVKDNRYSELEGISAMMLNRPANDHVTNVGGLLND